MENLLQIFTLGGVQIRCAGKPVSGLASRKAEALLIYLACSQRSQPREVLAELLWDERSQSQAMANLRVVLTSLRQQLGAFVEISRDSVHLNQKAQIWVDALELNQRLEKVRRQGGIHSSEAITLVEQACQLYQGEFLAGFSIFECRGFEQWLTSERERLHLAMTSTLLALVEYERANGRLAAGLAHASRLLELDPLMESAHQQNMLLLAYAGRRSAALAQYETCRRLLREELGISPSTETEALYKAIRSGEEFTEARRLQGLRGYELKEQIGESAFANTFRAFQPVVNREVVVKIIKQPFANDPDFIRRFEAEAEIIARLEHPHIVPLYDFWREPDNAYLVMRYMRGGSLAELIKRGAVKEAQCLKLIEQVCAGLAAAHRIGVVYQDLKPANIVLDEAGNAYLTDFSIAGNPFYALQGSQSDIITGASAYTPPEILRGEPPTPQSDIYSLGILLYEILTGERPFHKETPARMMDRYLNSPLPSVVERRPDLPSQVDQVIQRATNKDPTLRYPDALALAGDFLQAMENFLAPAHAEALTPSLPIVVPPNPYKGLRTFEEADAANFFGRDALIKRLLKRLEEDESYSRFLAVVGPSGGGKSSVVRAGLIPALRRGALTGSDQWFILTMLPGAHPLEELEISLLRLASERSLNLHETLHRDTRGVLRASSLVMPGKDDQLLLVIDQFEEVFTLVEDKAEVRFFLDSLYAAVNEPRSPLRLVITLRADFYDRPLMHPNFSALVQQRTEVVTPLTTSELEDAINEPARLAGASLEPGLTAAIVADVADQPGSLPLLQYALTELYERCQGNLLTHEAYRSIGGVMGALGKRAEEIYAALGEGGKETAKQLFLRLVTLGEGVEDTRRRAMRSELEAIVPASFVGITPLAAIESSEAGSVSETPEALHLNLTAFGNARLLSFDRDPLTRTPTVELAHEALLREWSRLRNWLDASRADLRMERVLANSARDWSMANQDPSFLLRGTRLEQFEGWAASTDLALTRQELSFLEACRVERESQRAIETARQAHEAALEQRSRRILRLMVAVFAVAAVIALLLSVFAFNQRNLANINAATATFAQGQALQQADLAATRAAEANAQRVTAVAESELRSTAEAIADGERLLARQQERLAFARELSMAAINNLEVDPERSVLLAIQSLQASDTLEGVNALHQALPALRLRQRLPHLAEVLSVAYSPDGRYLATGEDDSTVQVWDISAGQLSYAFTVPESNVWDLAFSSDGRLLATLGNQVQDDWSSGVIRLWQVSSNQAPAEPLYTLNNTVGGGYSRLAFSSDGLRMAASHMMNLIEILDITSGKTTSLDVQAELTSLTFDPAGGRLAIATGESVQIFDLANNSLLLNIPVGNTSALAYSPDGERLVTGDWLANGMIRVWEADTGQLLVTMVGQQNLGVQQVAFSPDGKKVFSCSQDGTAKVWDAESGMLEMTLTGHLARIYDFSLSPDGVYLATASGDKTARVWDVSASGKRELLTVPLKPIMAGADRPDATQALILGLDGIANVFDLSTGRVVLSYTLAGLEGWITSLLYSPDGASLAGAVEDQTVRIWDAQTGQLLKTLSGQDSAFTRLAYRPDGKQLAIGNKAGNILVWEIASEAIVSTLAAHSAPITALAFAPDGSALASGDAVGQVILWDSQTGQVIKTFTGHEFGKGIRSIDFNKDGRLLATASLDNTARVWDLISGQETLQLTGHTATVWSVRFSPDGRQLATSSADGSAKIWDATNGRELTTLSDHQALVVVAFFSQDGKRLFTVGLDLTIRSYLLNSRDLVSLARSRVTRALTQEECQRYLHSDTCPISP